MVSPIPEVAPVSSGSVITQETGMSAVSEVNPISATLITNSGISSASGVGNSNMNGVPVQNINNGVGVGETINNSSAVTENQNVMNNLNNTVVTTDGLQPFDISSMFANNNQ